MLEREYNELELCTFKPQINKTYVTKGNHVPNGYGKTIGRIRKANENNQEK